MAPQLYPLSAGQRNILLASHLYPGSPVNNVGGLMLLEDELDFDLLEKAISLCVARIDALRLRFVHKSRITHPYAILYLNVMEQSFDNPAPVRAGFADFSHTGWEEMEQALAQWTARPFDISQGQLYRFTMIKAPDGRQGVFSVIDHMVTDAWTSVLLARELAEVYYALKESSELPKAPQSYLTFLREEQEYMRSPQYRLDRAFWMERFKKRPHRSYLVGGKKYTASKSGCAKRYEPTLPADVQQPLEAFCRQNRISAPTALNCALGILLSRAADTPDVTINHPVIMRATLREKNTGGPMINTVANRMSVRDDSCFLEACTQAQGDMAAMMRHARYPFAVMIGEVLARHLTNPFFDTYFSFQTARLTLSRPVRFETKWIPSGTFASPFMLSAVDLNNTGALQMIYECQSEPYGTERVKSIHEDLMSILRNGLVQPQARIHSL